MAGYAAISVSPGLIRDETVRLRLRQVALFCTLILSGGNPLVPREPLIAFVLLVAFVLRSPGVLVGREFMRIWGLIFLFMLANLISYEAGHLGGLGGRYGNLLSAIALLSVYAFERQPQLGTDLLPILRLMAIQAILTPVIALVVPPFMFTQYVLGSGADVTTYRSFLFLFTYHDVSTLPTLIKRPDGFFWEPGVFQVYLNIFVYLAVFRTKRPLDIGLAILSVISLQSTVGLAILCLVVGAAVAENWRRANARQRWLAMVMAPLFLIPLALLTYQNINEKFYGAGRGSAIARLFDATTGWNIIKNYPVAGIGFDSDRYVEESYYLRDRTTELSDRITVGRTSSNGIVEMMTMVGVPLSLLFLWGVFRQRFFRRRAVFAGILLLTFFSEPLPLLPFFALIIFSGWLVTRQRSAVRRPFGRAIGSPARAVTRAS